MTAVWDSIIIAHIERGSKYRRNKSNKFSKSICLEEYNGDVLLSYIHIMWSKLAKLAVDRIRLPVTQCETNSVANSSCKYFRNRFCNNLSHSKWMISFKFAFRFRLLFSDLLLLRLFWSLLYCIGPAVGGNVAVWELRKSVQLINLFEQLKIDTNFAVCCRFGLDVSEFWCLPFVSNRFINKEWTKNKMKKNATTTKK